MIFLLSTLPRLKPKSAKRPQLRPNQRPRKQRKRKLITVKIIWAPSLPPLNPQFQTSIPPLPELPCKLVLLSQRRASSKNGIENKPERSFQMSKRKFKLP